MKESNYFFKKKSVFYRCSRNKVIIGIFFFFIVFSTSILTAQFENVRVDNGEAYQPNEVTIAVNPKDPNNLVAGSNLRYFYYSHDCGKTWTQGVLSSVYGVWGDPSIAFNGKGEVFFAHLSNPLHGDWVDRIVVQKSVDKGETWNDGAGVGLNPPKDQDKEWIVADLTNSEYRNNLYISWTEFDHYGSTDTEDSTRILFSRSENFGESWSDPVRISDKGGDCIDNDNTVEGAVPTVGPEGEIYISWAGSSRIMFDRSFDGGVTFGKDIFVTDQPGGWTTIVPGMNRCNGLPVTVCDISNSPHRGTVYILWSDDRNGDYDIFITKSIDCGVSWSEAKQVNNDVSSRDQFFPWIAVDPVTGNLYVDFYDRRNTSGLATEVYMAVSRDGGESFTNIKISETAFTPNSAVFFGDYINITALNGRVYPIWMRMDEEVMSLWAAAINDSSLTSVSNSDREKIIREFRLQATFPNPFNAVTKINYSLPRSSRVKISIFNSSGQLIENLVHREQGPGRFSITWDASNFSSGLYLYSLQTEDHFEVRKCMLLK